MALHNLTAIRVREPGFSPSECLELARKIENAADYLMFGWFDPDGDEADDLGKIEQALIVAALRAYAE